MIDIITPTGDRPLQFSFCWQWMAKQTFSGPVNWIIVDDSSEHYPTPSMPDNWEVQHIKKPKNPGIKNSSQAVNIMCATEYLKYDNIVMIEDDDYYSPKWLDICYEALKTHSLIGRDNIIFYNMYSRSYWDKSYAGFDTNAMAQTALRKSLIPNLKNACLVDMDPTGMVDHNLWVSVDKKDKILLGRGHVEYVVGIKGLPGRAGMSNKHKQRLINSDHDFSALRKIVGEEAFSIYMRTLGHA
jgi:hypothetical protein